MIEPIKREFGPTGNRIPYYVWEGIAADSEMEALELLFNSAHAQAAGEFGGAQVYFEGSLDGSTYGLLPVAFSEQRFLIDSRIVYLRGPVRFLRPKVKNTSDKTRLSLVLLAAS